MRLLARQRCRPVSGLLRLRLPGTERFSRMCKYSPSAHSTAASRRSSYCRIPRCGRRIRLDQELLAFLQSTYEAAADLGIGIGHRWNETCPVRSRPSREPEVARPKIASLVRPPRACSSRKVPHWTIGSFKGRPATSNSRALPDACSRTPPASGLLVRTASWRARTGPPRVPTSTRPS